MPKGEKYKQRDFAVEEHLSLFGCGLNASVSRIILGGPGRPAGDVARKLSDAGRLTIHNRLLPGGVNLLTPSVTTCRDHNVPVRRANLPGGPAGLDAMIQRLVFCCLSDKRRFLLEPSETQLLTHAVFQANIFHALDNTPRLLRLFCASAAKESITKSVRNHIQQARTKCSKQLRAGDYGIAVLAPTKASVKKYEKQIATLRQDAFISIHEVPDCDNLSSYLRRLRKSES